MEAAGDHSGEGMNSNNHPLRIPHIRAGELRRDQTEPEKRLWSRLRNSRLNGFKFRRQFPVGQFVADFACPRSKLIVELDGAQHIEAIAKDKRRTRLLAEHGYSVIRFWNGEVLENLEGVLEKILQELESDRK